MPRGAALAELGRSGSIYPVLRHVGDADIVAVRGGVIVSRGQFLADVAALAARLPAHRYVMNLCTDRYRFMVGFAASLCRGQVSLLPPAVAPGVLQAVAEDYPDLYVLTDAVAEMQFPTLLFPDDLEAAAAGGVPEVPGVQPALILFTSGSTGRPAPVPKSWGVLVRSARAAGSRLGVAAMGGATVIGTVPHQHSYGLESMILLAWQHGLIVDAGGLFFPADIRAALAAADQKSILVTTPVHLRALVAEPGGMPPAALILSATAPLPLCLAAAAEACFRAPLVEIYGCTEAGQVATRRTVRDAAWQCLDGVTLTVRDGGAWASGAAVEGTARLHDEIEQTGPDIFLLGGRSADLVDVAGKRTSLEYLNRQLLEIGGVSDGVFLKPESGGEGVARLAAVVVAPGLLAEAIMAALRTRIDAAFLPRPLVLVAALPRNALGKLPRDALLRLLRGDGGAEIQFAADHRVAAGHFPGNPIIPGALLLDEIVRVLGGAAGERLVIKSAKFFRPVRPGEALRVEWRSLAGGARKFECRLSGQGTLVASGVIETGDAA